MKAMIFALSMLTLTSSAALALSPIPSRQKLNAHLVASFTTGYVESLRMNLTFTQESHGDWRIERFIQCSSFPCDTEMNTILSSASVTKAEDLRAGDGPLTIELSNGMNIVCRSGFEAPGSRKKTPCSVSLVENGQPVTLDLYLQAHVEVR
jgi:hypothetical protein